MKPRLTLVTLGVEDLERALRFYRDGLGLPTEGVVGTKYEFGAVVFFELQGGMKLALWPRKSMEKDTGLAIDASRGPAPVMLAHNVATRDEVAQLLAQAEAAGATIVTPAREAFWGGRTGHFRDPDGHLWEIAWNPKWNPPVDG